MLTVDISSRCCTRDETPLETLLASGKFPGEIYRATCTGKCRGLLARFVAKIFATRLFQCFQWRRVCRCVIGAYTQAWRTCVTRTYASRVHRCMCTSYSMTMENVLLLCRLYLSIVFHANKRKRSHLLLLSCQDSKSLLNYYAISRKQPCDWTV